MEFLKFRRKYFAASSTGLIFHPKKLFYFFKHRAEYYGCKYFTETFHHFISRFDSSVILFKHIIQIFYIAMLRSTKCVFYSRTQRGFFISCDLFRRYIGCFMALIEEGFGGCTNFGECEEACPKGISIKFIGQMNRDYLRATVCEPIDQTGKMQAQ